MQIEVARQDAGWVRDTVDQQEFPGRFERHQVPAQGEGVLAYPRDWLLEGHQNTRLPDQGAAIETFEGEDRLTTPGAAPDERRPARREAAVEHGIEPVNVGLHLRQCHSRLRNVWVCIHWFGLRHEPPLVVSCSGRLSERVS
jgi:hypothetical protein